MDLQSMSNKLTNFQEITGMALDISDEEAAKVQKAWPATENELRSVLRQWNIIANAGIPGLQLLTACKAIWEYKPDDLAEAQGRTILYHPIDGTEIPERSPLDKLSWEMLAFLRWAFKSGHLKWSDEVVIAREIKDTGGLIDNLPHDRFYAKSLLPYLSDGNIDWSDVDLALAKNTVLTGEQSTDPLPSVTVPLYHDETRLEGLLTLIPALASPDARSHLLRGLPPAPCGAIRRSSAISIDLNNIVEAARGFGQLTNGKIAINVVIDNAMRLVRGTATDSKLEAFKVAK